MARKPTAYPHPTASAERLVIDANIVAGFMETFIQPYLDRAKPIAPFHYELWEWDCSNAELGVAAAPRGHAKTTAITIVGALADVLFGVEDFEILIGANEKKAAQFLENISYILTDPTFIDLQSAFQAEVLKCNETELVGRVKGREFCIMARGKGQKVRGELWRQMRPGKIRVDDLENDEDVKNDDTRLKDQRWFENAVIPALADGGKIRMLGTILHADSLIAKYLDDSQLNEEALREAGKVPQWYGRRYSAHKSMNDFSEILWAEKFTEERLRRIQARYKNQGNLDGYAQEYLSTAIAEGNEFFKPEGFVEMTDVDFRRSMRRYGAIDFAVSEKKDTDNTAFAIVGVNSDNQRCVLDMRAEVMSTLAAAELWFELDTLYHPEVWYVEDENISKSAGPFIELMMQEKNHFLPIELMKPKQDKKMRARSWQAAHAARWCRYNKQMVGGYEELETEMKGFPRAKHDDRVDALSMIGLKLHELGRALSPEEQAEEDYEEMIEGAGQSGRDSITGY